MGIPDDDDAPDELSPHSRWVVAFTDCACCSQLFEIPDNGPTAFLRMLRDTELGKEHKKLRRRLIREHSITKEDLADCSTTVSKAIAALFQGLNDSELEMVVDLRQKGLEEIAQMKTRSTPELAAQFDFVSDCFKTAAALVQCELTNGNFYQLLEQARELRVRRLSFVSKREME